MFCLSIEIVWISGRKQVFHVSFWVHPTKMDVHQDYRSMMDILLEDDPLGQYGILGVTKSERSASGDISIESYRAT